MTNSFREFSLRPFGPRSGAVTVGVLIAALGATGCSDAQRGDWAVNGRHEMVAADHALASRAGLDVLRAGGNAVDAAIAVSLTLAVVRPESTGLGGGGFMIVRQADGTVTALDYRERAPGAADAAMYTRAVAAHPERAPPSVLGHLAVATPGQLAGLAEAHKRWGTQTWPVLTEAARQCAERGFRVDEHYAEATADVLKRYNEHPELRTSCPYVYDVHLRNGRLRKPGDRLRQPGMAELMQAIAESGPDAVRRGIFADALAETMSAHGGIVTARDVAEYQVTQREALRGTYRDYDVITMPPPSSGGVCVLETLNILEAVRQRAGVGALAEATAYKHYLIEAMKHAFADRSRWLGDADFTNVPVELLTSKVYAAALAEGIDGSSVSPIETYGAVSIPTDAGTSHFCVADRWGNVVVSTETINGYFGSLAAIDRWGVILNNEMDDFTALPDEANLYGLRQSQRNAVEPYKRPLSSMSPTIVVRDDKPVLLLGGSGGPRIISAVLNVMLGVLDRGMSLREAMVAPRVHHQWQPDEVYFDRTPSVGMLRGLEQRGHHVSEKRKKGMVQSIQIMSIKGPTRVCRKGERTLIGASDPGKGGKPAGY
ncbi:MAG: gamma-glutamyltransferase [Phycisphaerales bacterium]|nr:gamma-glutamyltransferase [Phycisphaerales bacterium]